MTKRLLILLTATVLSVKVSGDVIEWTGGPLVFPNDEIKTAMRATSRYISKNVIASRTQIYEDDIYVALPRYKPGVPITLAKLSESKDLGPVLSPYPDWSIQKEDKFDGLHSIVDICIDSHGLLWALDVGVINTLDNPLRKNPPKVVVFDLETGKKLKTLDLSGLVVQASRLQFIVVEYDLDGKPFVYITDAATRSILVFDVLGSKGFRLVLPKAITGGKRDVLYACLVRKECGKNNLIITYLSGLRIFSISTDYIRSGSASGNIQDLGVKSGKIILLGTDGGSALFYRYKGNPDIYRWDSNSSTFETAEKVYTSPSGYLATEVIPDRKRTVMRVLESNFPDFLQGTVGCGTSQRLALMVSNITE